MTTHIYVWEIPAEWSWNRYRCDRSSLKAKWKIGTKEELLPVTLNGLPMNTISDINALGYRTNNDCGTDQLHLEFMAISESRKLPRVICIFTNGSWRQRLAHMLNTFKQFETQCSSYKFLPTNNNGIRHISSEVIFNDVTVNSK